MTKCQLFLEDSNASRDVCHSGVPLLPSDVHNIHALNIQNVLLAPTI